MPRRVRSSDRRFPSTPASGCGTTAMLALESAQRACDSAGVSPREISLLILCKTTPDQSVPATSSAVAGALGIGGGAMDLNLCRVYVRTGHGSGPYLGGSWKSLGYRRGDFDANHELGGPYQRVPFRRRSGGRRARASRRPGIPAWLEPRSRWVSRRVALRRSRVGNRANRRIMDAVAERLRVPIDRVASIIGRSGNTSAASIPLALVDAVEQGRLRHGDLVLLAGFGAGMTWASAVLRWDSRAGGESR